MSQSLVNGFVYGGSTVIGDGPNLDAFSRLRVSSPAGLLDSQFTYDLQPLIFEQITSGTGATITHDSTNRAATLSFSSTPTGGKSIMQTYEWFRYQAGRSQLPIITFNFNGGVANVIKFAEYGDGTNAYGFRMNGTSPEFYILSGTSLGNQVVAQSSWNLDKLDGTGASGITFDSSKQHILVIDFQALYVGRVRMGLDIGGQILYCHEFLHSNVTASPYIQTASLPIRVGMTCTGTVTTSMTFNCSTVLSEGGFEDVPGFPFVQESSVTAGNGTRTHALSLRPRTTFNSLVNRSKFVLEDVAILVTGANPVLWELCLGQAISGTTTYNNVNSTYSAIEYNTAGTISGSATIVLAQGYVAATNQSRASSNFKLSGKFPITLDSAGVARSLGTLSLVLTGIGGSSASRCAVSWKEIR